MRKLAIFFSFIFHSVEDGGSKLFVPVHGTLVIITYVSSVRTFCLSGTISQYLLVRFDSFLVQMISAMNSRYPISLVKIDPFTLELLPLFKYWQL